MNVPSVEELVKSQGLEIMADADEDRDAWLEARKLVITASDIPAIVGAVPGMSRVWYQRKGWVQRPHFSDQTLEAMEMGHHSEEFNAQLFRVKTARVTTSCQKLIRNPQYPWLAVTPDFFQWPVEASGQIINPAGYGILETKSTGSKDNWPEGEEPTIKWQIQLQAQMLVLGASWGSLSAILGSPYIHHRCTDFAAHAETQDLILQRTRIFMDSLADDDPPWDEEGESHAQAIRELTLQCLTGEAVTLGAEAVEWSSELEALESELRTLEQRKSELRNKVTIAMGNAIYGIMPNGDRWTLKPQSRAEHVVKESTSRVLRIDRAETRKRKSRKGE